MVRQRITGKTPPRFTASALPVVGVDGGPDSGGAATTPGVFSGDLVAKEGFRWVVSDCQSGSGADPGEVYERLPVGSFACGDKAVFVSAGRGTLVAKVAQEDIPTYVGELAARFASYARCREPFERGDLNEDELRKRMLFGSHGERRDRGVRSPS